MTPEDLGRLLSLISHEMRAPLGVVRGYLRLLEQQGAALPENQRHAVAAALRASDRAADLLTDLGALARFERREASPSLRPTALAPLLQSAAESVALPDDPAIALEVGAVPDASIRADEPWLRRAIAGLITAVVRAQVSDTAVSIGGRHDVRAGRPGVAVTITNATHEEPIAADRPLDVTRGGLGLELPIAHWIVQAHGGHVGESWTHDRLAAVVLWVPLE